MKKLGISIYPEKTTEEKLINYIDKAYSAGFSRIFSCLLSSAQNKGIEDKEIIDTELQLKDLETIEAQLAKEADDVAQEVDF